MLPVILFVALAVAAVVIAVPSRRQRRLQRQRRPAGDQRLAQWAGTVQSRLPEAFRVQHVTRSGLLQQGQRPLPVVLGKGAAIGYGWRWDLVLPGNSIADDWEGNRIVAALNTKVSLAAVAEVEQTVPGKATLSVWRRDPLTVDNVCPYKPGQLPVERWGDRWSLGRRRDGREVLLPLWLNGGGSFHTLFAGATGSGKTRWMLLGMAHAMQLGAEIYLIDLVKGVDDRDWLPVRPAVTEAWDHPKDVLAGLKQIHAETLTRPRWEPTDPTPFRLIVIDEIQSVIQLKDGLKVVTQLVSELRSKGAAVFAATQLPEVKQIDAIARTNMRIKMAGRLDNEQEYRAALGGKWQGSKIPDDPKHWGTGYVDLDGRGAQRFRGWHIDDAWLAAHARACGGVKVG